MRPMAHIPCHCHLSLVIQSPVEEMMSERGKDDPTSITEVLLESSDPLLKKEMAHLEAATSFQNLMGSDFVNACCFERLRPVKLSSV